MNARRMQLFVGSLALLVAGTAAAQMANPINPHNHGNLAAAQELAQQAIGRLDQAQAANDDQLGGHAQKAKLLLQQAQSEMVLAAQQSNRNRAAGH